MHNFSPSLSPFLSHSRRRLLPLFVALTPMECRNPPPRDEFEAVSFALLICVVVHGPRQRSVHFLASTEADLRIAVALSLVLAMYRPAQSPATRLSMNKYTVCLFPLSIPDGRPRHAHHPPFRHRENFRLTTPTHQQNPQPHPSTSAILLVIRSYQQTPR